MAQWLDQLRAAAPTMVTFTDCPLEMTWAWRMVKAVEEETDQPVYSADHPNEPRDRYACPQDAVRSQCVLHERFHWLLRAHHLHPEVETWVWLEPTIFKQRGITHELVQQFLQDVETHPVDAISLPGIWPKMAINDPINHWRFAGSCWVCPAKYAHDVYYTARDLVHLRTRCTNRLCWDNSSWSYLELLNVLPMRWYPGNHDETQMTGYLTGIVS
jgi:hypothetical protein